MNKGTEDYSYNGIIFGNKKVKKLLIHATAWITPKTVMLGEGNKSQRITYYTIPLI